MKVRVLMEIVSVTVMMSLGAWGGVSVGDIYAAQTPGVYWSSVRQQTNAIALDWPQDATRAELMIRTVSERVAAQRIELAPGTTSYDWTPFAGEAPENDELYVLTLAYLNGETLVGNVQTAEVMVARSSFAAADLPIDESAASWNKVLGSAIIPYAAGWFTNAQASASSTLTRTKTGTALAAEDALSGTGWFGWNFKRSGFGSSGTFNLLLNNGDEAENLEAELRAMSSGFMLLLK